MDNPDLQALIAEIREFVAERDWGQFHTPKNLSMALAVEAAELMEHFQWLTPEASFNFPVPKKEKISHELADILVYLLRLSDVLQIDLIEATRKKISQNREKYPIEKVRGSAEKYDKY